MKTVKVKVQFIGLTQRYSNDKREIEMDLPADPKEAIDSIIKQFQMPWKNDLEKITRIFINNLIFENFTKKEELLKPGDIVAFITLSGGG